MENEEDEPSRQRDFGEIAKQQSVVQADEDGKDVLEAVHLTHEDGGSLGILRDLLHKVAVSDVLKKYFSIELIAKL